MPRKIATYMWFLRSIERMNKIYTNVLFV